MALQPAPGWSSIEARLLEFLAPLRSRWQALEARERQGVRWAAWVLGLYLGWALAVQPALRTLRSAPAQHESLDAQWSRMVRLAAEAQELRNLPTLGPAQSAEALRAATARLGDKARLVFSGDRAILTLKSTPPAEVRRWLAEARTSARARPLELQLTRNNEGRFDGTIAVGLSGGATP